MCLELDLSLSEMENETSSHQGASRIIERSPRNLIGEARMAFDAGLLISCLTVLVTIPDACSNLIDPSNNDGQRDWCTKYLGLPGAPVVDNIDRSREQSRDHIKHTMSALTRGGATSPHPISASCEMPCSIPDLPLLTARAQNTRRSI